ncbi:MAG: repeat protein [Bryobacterales bacterium]|nr:repeat protein [Bryobacterales bacterium]
MYRMSPSEVAVTSTAVEFELGQEALAGRRIPKALDHFYRAQCAGHDSDACASARWDCWMLLGDFERAWMESDSITSRASVDPHRLWDGADFEGKRVIIRCLHGFGDAIQFIRYARLIRSSAVSLTVETHAELVSLLSNAPYIDRVVSWADGSSKHFTGWNQQIEVMELPQAFRTTLRTVPSDVPYLKVSAEAIERSNRLLGEAPTRVGLLWGSGDWNPARSVPVYEFAPIAGTPGISFFSFQRGPRRADLSVLREHGPVHDTAEHSPDISDTAADLMNMDLLITVDTMAAHLAGALGKEVWLMLPFEADWRWMLDKSSTPWYPTMTLFRQSSPGDWRDVLRDISARLGARAAMSAG